MHADRQQTCSFRFMIMTMNEIETSAPCVSSSSLHCSGWLHYLLAQSIVFLLAISFTIIIKVHSHTHSEIWEQANSDMPALVNLGLWAFAAASLWSPLSEYASPVSLHKHKRCSFQFNSSLETAFKSLCATNTTSIFFQFYLQTKEGRGS